MTRSQTDPDLDELIARDPREAFGGDDFPERYEDDDFEAYNQNESMDYLEEGRDCMDEQDEYSIRMGSFDGEE